MKPALTGQCRLWYSHNSNASMIDSLYLACRIFSIRFMGGFLTNSGPLSILGAATIQSFFRTSRRGVPLDVSVQV